MIAWCNNEKIKIKAISTSDKTSELLFEIYSANRLSDFYYDQHSLEYSDSLTI
jgi:hypothetical protein